MNDTLVHHDSCFWNSIIHPQPHHQWQSCTPPFKVRRASLGDLMALTEVLTLSFHSCEGIFAWVSPIIRLGIYEDLRQRLTHGSDRYLCLAMVVHQPGSLSEQLVGTVEMGLRSLSPWPLADPHSFAYISNLAVHPHYRRRRIAQQLLWSCEFVAQQWGLAELYLHVLENNHAAMKLYTRLGYQLQETEWSLNTFFFQQPRRCFLRKTLAQTLSTEPSSNLEKGLTS